MEKYEKNEEDGEKSVQMRRTFLRKEMRSVYLLSGMCYMNYNFINSLGVKVKTPLAITISKQVLGFLTLSTITLGVDGPL